MNGFGPVNPLPDTGIDITALHKAGIQHFHSNGVTGKNVVFCCIDNGINGGFGKIPSKIAWGPYPYNFVYGDNNHGQRVASVFYEGCPDAAMLAYSLEAPRGLGRSITTDDITVCLRDIYAKAKADSKSMYIVNISQGGSTIGQGVSEMREVIKDLNAIGVPVVCASGNEGANTSNYPAIIPEAVSVGGVHNNGQWRPTSSSNAEVDFAHLAEKVPVYYCENNRIVMTTDSGTSFATPAFCAQFALIAEAYFIKRGYRAEELELYELAKSMCIDLGDAGRDYRTGHGFIDLTRYSFANGLPVPSQPEKPKGETMVRNLKLTDPYMRGDDVKALQQRLLLWGLLPEKEVDGVFGPKTEAAVKAFQKEKRLTVDGIAGPKTLDALLVDSSTPTPEPEPPVSDIATGLVAHARRYIGHHYAWGGNGETNATESWIKSRDQSESKADRAIKHLRKLKAGGMVNIRSFDCSGLISRYLQDLGKVPSKRNCNHLWAMCKPITKAQAKPGDLPFRGKPGDFYHVGVFAEDNQVIEAKGRDDGVVIRGIDADPAQGDKYWTHFGRLDI